MKVQNIKNKYKEEPTMESRRGQKGKKRGYRTGEDDVMHSQKIKETYDRIWHSEDRAS
jgi:hypothetical protein